MANLLDRALDRSVVLGYSKVGSALRLQRGGDLDRLDRRAEGARERAGDHALEPLLETLESAHVASFPLSWCLVVVMAGLSAALWRDRLDCIGADPSSPVPVG